MGNEEEKIIEKNLERLRKTLEESHKKYDRIENIGLKLQKKGNKLVKYARLGKKCIDHQLREAPKIAKSYKDFPDSINILDRWYMSGQRSNEWLKSSEEKLNESIEDIELGVTPVSSSATSTCSDISGTAVSIIHQDKKADNKFISNYELNISADFDRTFVQNDLDKELDNIKTGLSKRRKGAWDTFNSVSRDKLSQAANSMRDILRYLISKWASNDDVKKAKWWKPVENSKSDISQKQRIRYLLFGTDKIIDEGLLERINEEITRIKESNDILNQTAHGSRKYKELVEYNMIQIEDTIHSIIYMRKIFADS